MERQEEEFSDLPFMFRIFNYLLPHADPIHNPNSKYFIIIMKLYASLRKDMVITEKDIAVIKRF